MCLASVFQTKNKQINVLEVQLNRIKNILKISAFQCLMYSEFSQIPYGFMELSVNVKSI